MLVYSLTAISGDPLKDLRESTDPNRENLMEQRIRQMGLDQPIWVRYWGWLSGILGCFRGSCDLGLDRSGQNVGDLLSLAAGSTIRLVLLATILGILLGVFFGVMTAIRQYSGFDYVITAVAFVFYSLPSFVFAVLLKEFGAIGFNNWLKDPNFSFLFILLAAALFAIFCQAIVAGDMRTRLTVGGGAFVLAAALMFIFDVTNFIANPVGGPWVPLVGGIAAAVLFTSLFTSLSNRRALLSALATVAVVVVLSFAMSPLMRNPGAGTLLLFALIGLAAAVIIGLVFGDYARRSIVWANIWVAISTVLAVCVDYMMRYWVEYVRLVNNRPISTIGSETPNFRGSGSFWLSLIDSSTHVILPTISLTLISVASYTRYTRSSMLDVLEQDYVRTARSKGLSERVVITRHAFRNAMLPITTIVAFDFAGLIGGAVITETVFGWKGMGELFKTGLDHVDPNPVMAFFLVTGTIAVLMNMAADIAYAYIDPRIRR
ncbi:MAG: ABC transporter permease [Trueperella sp.]|nr:ABC transporter permease [Trueperella sp.]